MTYTKLSVSNDVTRPKPLIQLNYKKLICTFFTQVTAEEVTVQLYILFKIFMAIIIVFEA